MIGRGLNMDLPPEPIRKRKEQKSTPKVTTKKEKRKTQGQDIRKLFRNIAEKKEKEDEIDLRIERKTTKADCIEIDYKEKLSRLYRILKEERKKHKKNTTFYLNFAWINFCESLQK